jgi:hypothetical protein
MMDAYRVEVNNIELPIPDNRKMSVNESPLEKRISIEEK